MYCTYILQSTVTSRYYTGSTEDLENRFTEHNQGEMSSTRNGIPWKIIHVEYFTTRALAVRRERQIKSRGAKRYLEDLKNKNDTLRSG